MASPVFKIGNRPRKLCDHSGFVLVQVPGHPVAKNLNMHMVPLQNLVMEQHLGRLLSPTEQVEHVDGDVTNNDLPNLKLVATLPTFSSDGLTNSGLTTHFQFVYDTRIPYDTAIAQVNALMVAAESDYALLKTWFGGIDFQPPFSSPELIRINYSLTPGGATWTYPPDQSVLDITPQVGADLLELRHLVNAELVEQFAFKQGQAWFYNYDLLHGGNEGSHGEGLSLWGAVEVQRATGGPPRWVLGGAYGANLWMTSGRYDWINNVWQNTIKPEANSCNEMFLNWLKYQLGYTTTQIIAAAPGTSHLADPMRQVYRNLTGSSADPFPQFKALLDANYPGSSSIPSADNPESPFPLSFTAAPPGGDDTLSPFASGGSNGNGTIVIPAGPGAISYVDRRDTANRLARVGITDVQDVQQLLLYIDPDYVRIISDPMLAAYLGVIYIPIDPNPGGGGGGTNPTAFAPSPNNFPADYLAPLTGYKSHNPGDGTDPDPNPGDSGTGPSTYPGSNTYPSNHTYPIS